VPRVLNSKANVTLTILATLLSAFNGFLSILTVLVFSGHESTRLWVSIYLPAALWVLALACFRLPRSGFVAYTVILAIAIFLCANPMQRDNPSAALYQCSYNLRFAILGAALLLANLFVRREASSEAQLR
jgi:hypothetical protein